MNLKSKIQKNFSNRLIFCQLKFRKKSIVILYLLYKYLKRRINYDSSFCCIFIYPLYKNAIISSKNRKAFGIINILIVGTMISLFILSATNLYLSLASNVDKTKNNLIISTITQNVWKEIAVQDFNSIQNKIYQYRDTDYDIEILVGNSEINNQGNMFKPVTINVYDRNDNNKKISSTTGRKPKLLIKATGVFEKNGWTRLPNGIIYQWGYHPVGNGVRQAENIVIPLNKLDTKVCYTGNVTLHMSNSVSGTIIPYMKSLNNQQIIVNVDAANGAKEHDVNGIYWQAICQE